MVHKVVALYSNALHAKKTLEGDVVATHYMEETPNKNDGSRFLIELDIQLYKPTEELVHISEYVYLHKASNVLCHTSNFQWTKNAEVYFIVAGKMCPYL